MPTALSMPDDGFIETSPQARTSTSGPADDTDLSGAMAALRPPSPLADAARDSRAVGRAVLTLQRSERLRPGDLSVEP